MVVVTNKTDVSPREHRQRLGKKWTDCSKAQKVKVKQKLE